MVMPDGAGHGAPADGVEEGGQADRVVELPDGRRRQRGRGQDAGRRLELPDDRELLTEAVVLDAGQRRQVLTAVLRNAQDVRRQSPADDVANDPVPVADVDELPLFRHHVHDRHPLLVSCSRM
jgi:hypothetical protein